MLKDNLPKPKKNLKSFILEEDAKVMDKAATKIAITASFLAISALANTQDANAKGHGNHTNHQNDVNAPLHGGTGIHAGTNPTDNITHKVESKSIETWHANHYNHTDGSGNSVTGNGGGGSGIDLKDQDYVVPEAVLRELKEKEN
ncbi:MAG: hypothetical protein ACOC16_01695 [Nanoarchaeota archaeon]